MCGPPRCWPAKKAAASSRLSAQFSPPKREAWEKASGCKLEEIEQLHITLHNNDAKFPRTSFVVKTTQPLSKLELLGRWGDPDVAKEGTEAYYTGASWAYYIPSTPEDERCFAMGQLSDIKEVAAKSGAAAQVVPQMERLRRLTDADRHFTLLFFPPFLFNDDGEPLFTGDRSKARQPLSWLLGDHVQAASVSAHFADEFYLEARLRSSLDQEPYALAEELRSRLEKIPGSLEDYFVSLSASAILEEARVSLSGDGAGAPETDANRCRERHGRAQQRVAHCRGS